MAKRSVAACRLEIGRINARFRSLEDKDGEEWSRLCGEKDRLIDEMASLCDHPAVIAIRGPKGRGICTRCGCCEARSPGKPFKALAGRPTTYLVAAEYLPQEGAVVKRLGINL